MTKIYSGGALDGLLRVVASLGGDRLRLQTGHSPAAFAGAQPLRLTLPATSSSMLRALCGDLGAAYQAQSPDEAGSRFWYASADGARFEVRIRGSLEDDGSASILVLPADASEAAEERSPAPLSGSGEESPPARPAGSGGRSVLFGRPGDDSVRGSATASSNGGTAMIASTDASTPGILPVSGVAGGAPDGRPQMAPSLARVVVAAIAAGATDVHLTETAAPVFRVGGRLVTHSELAVDARSLVDEARRALVLAGHAVDFAFGFEGTHRVRANVYLAQQGVCAALRILRAEAPDLAQLRLPEEVTALTRTRDGLLLFCGATGAGKSTSMAALTRHLLENDAVLCISLESPIEYDLSPQRGHSHVRQREVGQHVASFAAGLRDCLREDPDVILIGEMRDRETAALALTAAETGHLVLSSLHCRGATSAVERIVDLFPAEQQNQVRRQLADALRAIVSQQLLPARRGDGQVVAVEVLTMNSAAAHLIREGKAEQLSTVIHAGKQAGMLPLERDLARLVKEGRVEQSVARARVRSPELFDQWK